MSRFLTFLTLSDSMTITGGALQIAMRSDPANLLREVTALTGPGEGNAFLLMVDKIAVSVMQIEAPLPSDSWTVPVELDFTWPAARAAMEKARAHVVLGIVNLGAGTPLEQATAITIVAAKLSYLLPVTGAVFSEAARVVEPSVLRDAAEMLTAQQVPIEAWVALRLLSEGTGADRKVGAMTYGLEHFIGREIEFEPIAAVPVEVARRVLGLAQYLIAKGLVIQDGDTVGMTTEEKIRARYLAQGRRPGIPVLSLTVEAIDENAPPTRVAGEDFGGKPRTRGEEGQ